MSTFLFAIVVFVTLTGLYVWAQRRAHAIRKQSARREQSAMALMLAGGGAVEAEMQDAAEEPVVKRKVIGRLLEDDPAEKAAAAARHAAARSTASDKAKRELPPLEFGHTKSHRKSKRNGAHNGAHESTPAEQAAAGLDPIEDLISQIMVHEPSPQSRSHSATPSRAPARTVEPHARKPDSMAPSNVPLRELVLAWYESRGYRKSPASPAVWPIELVLRHREDAARAYAFVVQNDHVSVDRITALIEQAREIGMMRVAVIAEAGYERGAKEIAKRRHVRLIDRSSMEAELSELQLPTAAKIIAVARARSAAESPAA
ncbi:MAG TPA: hypothetical protein VES91_03830 [Burkholderiaceae bacterium]|nr:hypothetical protein [Burkholderiaceae bacterium]